MLFSSVVFIFLFAPLAIGAYWLTPKRYRLHLLTAASYFFYGWWDWRFCFLMLFSTWVDYIAAPRIAKASTPARARAWLIVSLVSNLGLLAFFKYAGFFSESLNAILVYLRGGSTFPVLDIILPVGISFYTFQSMSYTIDVYRKEAKPTDSFIHFAAFVSMFPQLVAGPIVRYTQLDDQLRNLPQRLTTANLNLGLTFFAVGLCKKVLIADRIAYYSDPLWRDFAHIAPGEAWAAVIGYTLQVYFDFSGYSLMAIGLGHLLGLKLPQNFNSPYKSKNIGEFWHRWHMSLSYWMRDYLYIPLGGKYRKWLSIPVTFILAGLWHGAAWTFVIWGCYHAVLLSARSILVSLNLRWKAPLLGQIGTLLLVMIGRVFFHSESLAGSLGVFVNLFDISRFLEHCTIPKTFFSLTIPALLWAMFGPNTYELIHVNGARPRAWVMIILGILTALAILFLGDTSPFLYYQF